MENSVLKWGSRAGATAGGVFFLFFGIIPGFYFGSYGALVLLSHLFGGPLEPTSAVKVFMAAGIALGVFSMAAVHIVVGSLFGTLTGYVLSFGKAGSK